MKKYLFYPLFLMLAVLTLTACADEKPEDTLETFFNAVAEGDIDTAIEQISFETVSVNEMAQAKGKIQMMVGQFKNHIDANDGLDSIETINTDISEKNDEVRIKSQLNFSNGKTSTENTRLRKFDGGWKIVLE
ncbi:DUF4878 domain-containing protein [Halomonas sp. LS-001]